MDSGMILHHTHEHPLLKAFHAQEFRCNGCNTLGFGWRYRCYPCNFDLHEQCFSCFQTLFSRMHSQHILYPVPLAQDLIGRNGSPCDVCKLAVNGVFYSCRDCNFNIHPICAQLPFSVQHAVHPPHPLTLQREPRHKCTTCRRDCSSWHYRCADCNVNFHLPCVLRIQPPIRPQMPPPPYGGYSYGMPSSSYPTNHAAPVDPAHGGGTTNGAGNMQMYAIVANLLAHAVTGAMF